MDRTGRIITGNSIYSIYRLGEDHQSALMPTWGISHNIEIDLEGGFINAKGGCFSECSVRRLTLYWVSIGSKFEWQAVRQMFKEES